VKLGVGSRECTVPLKKAVRCGSVRFERGYLVLEVLRVETSILLLGEEGLLEAGRRTIAVGYG
jgi:hypothetical protein